MNTNMNRETTKRSHYSYNEIEERFERRNRKKSKQEVKKTQRRHKYKDRDDDWD